jgi:hypothetical protein
MSALAALLGRLRARGPAAEAPPVLVGEHTDRLSRMGAIARGPDERPCREDLEAARPRHHRRMLG